MFFNGQPVWHTRTESGRDRYKFVSMAAVIQAFRNAPVDSGYLPPGVVRCGASAKGDFALLFIPARRHRLNVEAARGSSLKQVDLWLPAFAFFGIGSSYRVWAVKGDSLEPRGALYQAPLPNVFGDGAICWGQNTPPKAGGTVIAEAWRIFIESPFNGHAASDKSRSHKGDVRVLLRQVAKSGKRFPLSELVSAGGYSTGTLDRTVNRLIGGEGGDD
jgi:hypothetical protein